MKKFKFIAIAAAALAVAAIALAGCGGGAAQPQGGSSSAGSSAAPAAPVLDEKMMPIVERVGGKTVMTQVESAALEVLEGDQAALAAEFGELQTIDTFDNAFMQLDAGAVDAVACDLSYALYQDSKKPDTYEILEPYISEVEHYGVGFNLGDEALAAQVNATLQDLDANGTVKELCEKYGPKGISYDNWVLPKADGTVEIDPNVKLVVGFDAGYPPYGFIGEDGEYAGFDIDLAKAVCEANGWELQLEPIDWDAKDALLGSGTINCIWNGFTMEGREGQYAFSEPYMLNAQVIVVKK